MYSRRAMVKMLAQRAHDRLPAAARVRSSSVDGGADPLDEDVLERRVGDLEAQDLPAPGDGGPQDRLGVGAALDVQLRVVVASRASPVTPGSVSSQARPSPAPTSPPGPPGGRWTGATSRVVPDGDDPAVVDDRDRVAQLLGLSSWWVLNTIVLPRSRISRKASLSIATLTGSRPTNGSSMSSTSGSWRIVAMYWTFCWLPFDRRLGRRAPTSAIRNRASQRLAPPSARRGG